MNEKTQPAFSKLLSRFGYFAQIYWPHMTIIAVIIGVITVLIPKSLFHSFSCDLMSASTSFVSSDGFSLDGQVIIRGTRDEIRDLVVEPLGLVLIRGCNLSYLNSRDVQDPRLTDQQRESLVVQLYRLPQGVTFQNVNDTISNAKKNQPDLYIFASLNYLVSRSDTTTDPCGRPNSGGGSGGGKDFGDPGVLDPAIYDAARARDAFNDQWAFNAIDLTTSPGFTGRGVRVAVFDSSPFRTSLPLYRRIAIALPSPLWLKIRDTPASRNIKSSHGMFVAEIIHKIAPKSKIDLIHVLDDNGCTRLMPLIEALEAYTSRRTAWSGDLDKHVLNWSLGISMPYPPQGPDPSLKVLEETISDADRLGAIIVAAAGNDSNRMTNTGVTGRMDMQIPASYVTVIGVAATDPSGQPACYSNKGDVAAPGGDGGINPDNRTDLCAPRTDSLLDSPGSCTASDMEHCKYGVISIGLTDDGPQYMVWSGTSFSTAYISGVAALIYERGTHARVQCLITPDASSILTSDPVLGQGLINVTNSLQSTACP